MVVVLVLDVHVWFGVLRSGRVLVFSLQIQFVSLFFICLCLYAQQQKAEFQQWLSVTVSPVTETVTAFLPENNMPCGHARP